MYTFVWWKSWTKKSQKKIGQIDTLGKHINLLHQSSKDVNSFKENCDSRFFKKKMSFSAFYFIYKQFDVNKKSLFQLFTLSTSSLKCWTKTQIHKQPHGIHGINDQIFFFFSQTFKFIWLWSFVNYSLMRNGWRDKIF